MSLLDTDRRIDPKALKRVKVQERKWLVVPLPWRTRSLAVGEKRDIISWTDFPDKYGLETSAGHADLRTTINVTGPRTIFVAQEIQDWNRISDFTPTNQPPHEILLDPNKPTVVKAGWGKRAIVSVL
jgi:hypothetical protein